MMILYKPCASFGFTVFTAKLVYHVVVVSVGRLCLVLGGEVAESFLKVVGRVILPTCS